MISTSDYLLLAIRMECHTVDGAKMSLHSPKFLLKHGVVEASIKLANFGGRGGHIHGFLTTS